MGRKLFDSLLRGKVGDLYREDVGSRGEELAIALTFDPTDDEQMRLFALPWEWLHGGRDHLGLAGRPIVRRLRSRDGEMLAPLHVRKLRILAVPLADEGLDIGAEIRILKSIRQKSGAFHLEIVERSIPLVEIRRRLEEGGFHALHLMGHGRWHEAKGAWGVDLGGSFVTAAELATQLRSELSEVRLVVLNTCHGGRTLDPETAAATRGLASVLVDEGALAVVANRAPISDAAAHALTLGLYDRVARGWSLPQAITATRLDLHGQANAGRGVRKGEWATPILHLRSPGRVLIVEPRRWPLAALAAITGGALGAAALLATAGVWLAYPVELAVISLPIAGFLGRLAWGWLRHIFFDSHPLSSLADALTASPRRAVAWTCLLLTAGLSAWISLGKGRLERLPCLRSMPEQEWSRSVLVDFSSGEGIGGWSSRWKKDLRSVLKRKRLVPENSELGKQHRNCFAWSLVGQATLTEDREATTRFEILHRGREVDAIQLPGAPAYWQDSWLQRLQQILSGESPEALEGMSAQAEGDNREAIDAYLRGDVGRAVDLLRSAVNKEPGLATLRNNLAQILLDMASQKRLGGGLRSSEQDEQRLLHEALNHLDEAVALEPKNPVFYFHRGRVRQRLVELSAEDPGRAESDFRRALELSPDFPEPANDLAALLLDEGTEPGVQEALEILEKALLVVDAADRSTKAAILKNLGRARHAKGALGEAWAALDQAECLAPVPRRDLRAEILGRSAQLHFELLGPASADATWWRYSHFFLADGDEARRRAFFTWRSHHADRSGRERFELWPIRCDRGNFAVSTSTSAN